MQNYGLMKFVYESVKNAEYISLNKWKSKVKEIVMAGDIKRVNTSCKLYKSLDMLNLKTKHGIIGWWLFTFMIRTVIMLLFNISRLGKELYSLCEFI